MERLIEVTHTDIGYKEMVDVFAAIVAGSLDLYPYTEFTVSIVGRSSDGDGESEDEFGYIDG